MIRNLTPHTLNVHCEDQLSHELPPSGSVARVEVARERASDVEGLPTYRAVYGPVQNLPDPEEGVALVVSLFVAQACPRPDVFSPGELIRDSEGRPIGCRGLTPSM